MLELAAAVIDIDNALGEFYVPFEIATIASACSPMQPHVANAAA